MPGTPPRSPCAQPAGGRSRSPREGGEGVRSPLGPTAGAHYLQLQATLPAPLIFQPLHPRLPRRPAAPAGGGDAGGGGQFAPSPGNPPGWTRPEESPKVRCGRWSTGCGCPGRGRGVNLGGGARDARRHMEGTESGAVSVAPPHAPLRPRLPPPAGTSGFADWLMCPWKWLF